MFDFCDTVTKDFNKCNELIIWTGTLFFNLAKNRFFLSANQMNWLLIRHMIGVEFDVNLLVITAFCVVAIFVESMKKLKFNFSCFRFKKPVRNDAKPSMSTASRTVGLRRQLCIC